jgi:pimeloyl-ACP methyl ester carboxylesterase
MAAVLSPFLVAGAAAQDRPAIILVPGAFHQPLVFDKIIPILREANYKDIYAIDLPSVGEVVGRDRDVAAVRSVLDKELGKGHNVLLVGNSYGGTVIGEAVKGLKSLASKKGSNVYDRPSVRSIVSRKDKARGKILGLVFFAGYLPYIQHVQNPQSKPDVRNISPPYFDFSVPGKVTTFGQGKAATINAYYNDLSADEQERYVGKLPFSSFDSLNATATYIPYTGDFACTYVIGKRDNAVPEAFAQTYITQGGAQFKTEYIDAGHVPFIGKPSESVALIRKAAGENI